MDANGFKDFAKEMVDYVAGYLENIRDRLVKKKFNVVLIKISIKTC